MALDLGLTIQKVEIVLDFDGTEIVPKGYVSRTHLGEKKWRENPPQWHVVAWPLRRPWLADKERGPTFNAYLNGIGYWAKYGASDTDKDRFLTGFGPFELSRVVREGRVDVTAVFTDSVFGRDLGTRLRLMEENGLLLKKLETYDVRYRDVSDPYEWAVPTGGHGLRFKNPRLVVTFHHSVAQDLPLTPLTLPRSTDIAALATSLTRNGLGGKPTAVLPSTEEFKELAHCSVMKRPSGRKEWQVGRVMELYRVGGTASPVGLRQQKPATCRNTSG